MLCAAAFTLYAVASAGQRTPPDPTLITAIAQPSEPIVVSFASRSTPSPRPTPSPTPTPTAAAVTRTPSRQRPLATRAATPEPTPRATPKPTPRPTPKPTPKPTPQPTPGTYSRSEVEQQIREAWQGDDNKAIAVADCESGLNPRASSPSGINLGLWQMRRETWQSNGGPGNDPRDSSPYVQTQVAWRLYGQSGWSPWPGCA